jgi:hypothetical protein
MTNLLLAIALDVVGSQVFAEDFTLLPWEEIPPERAGQDEPIIFEMDGALLKSYEPCGDAVVHERLRRFPGNLADAEDREDSGSPEIAARRPTSTPDRQLVQCSFKQTDGFAPAAAEPVAGLTDLPNVPCGLASGPPRELPAVDHAAALNVSWQPEVPVPTSPRAQDLPGIVVKTIYVQPPSILALIASLLSLFEIFMARRRRIK